MTTPHSSVPTPADASASRRVLTLSTVAFTLMFAVWLMFGILGLPIRQEFGLSDVQLSWLSAVAVLNGSLWRLPAGIITDRLGGRRVIGAMLLLTAVPAFLIAHVQSYPALLGLAFLVGFAGNSFSVGVAWNSVWFPRTRQGAALGVFGAGNVGASVTKFIGPALIVAIPAAGLLGGFIPGGWRAIPFLYGVLLVLMGLAVLIFAPHQDRTPGQGRPLREMLAPLHSTRVWRFGLYYVVFFGAYVALSAWMPKYYVDVFGLPLYEAALLTALFIFPASLLRPLGGYLSDRYGARAATYGAFGLMALALLVMSMPSGHIVLYMPAADGATVTRDVMHFTLGVWPFTALLFVVGVAMGIGKASVYKHIPEYFPRDVGAVGGLVGMLGGLGGFFLTPLFAYAKSATGFPQSTFIVVLLITLLALAWMHLSIMQMMNRAAPHLQDRIEAHP
ncbi:NarK/NasA family nitrate transporter [Deinococcus detaillensis]|uniref:NarK/NasA family nitrate transporter n=1 Tax=Deinococcus detaillensis TaxID=2592048 RepID=A0A553UJK5_9DEIO|nr:MFS transporter [Deinococcus detaillensis]TSA80373.1 NarK/NasA family nitrate transporter [Deinococcus detaillensis]